MMAAVVLLCGPERRPAAIGDARGDGRIFFDDMSLIAESLVQLDQRAVDRSQDIFSPSLFPDSAASWRV
jgi:hypothetical protein